MQGISMNILMYDPDLVAPMREELVEVGFKELTTKEQVDKEIPSAKGISLLVVNSVCGCAAGSCRPGIHLALEHVKNKPDHLFTVFAGQDKEATTAARNLAPQYPPSSPSMIVFKDGKPVAHIPRQRIEGQMPAVVAKIVEETLEPFGS